VRAFRDELAAVLRQYEPRSDAPTDGQDGGRRFYTFAGYEMSDPGAIDRGRTADAALAAQGPPGSGPMLSQVVEAFKDSPAFQRRDAQTETPEFKRWFGDWEALRAQQRIDAMQPVPIVIPDAWRSLNTRELRERVEAQLDAMVRSKTIIEHPEVGAVRVERAGQKKTISEGRDPAKLLVAADMANVLPQAVVAGREVVTGQRNLRAFVKLVVPVDIGGNRMAAIFTLTERADGTAYYNTVALADEKQEAPAGAGASTSGPVRGSTAQAEGNPLLTEVAGFSRRPLRRVNPDDVSKVVDQDGRPLVVYHGTAGDFDAFDPARSKTTGVFFAARPEYAGIVAELEGNAAGRGGQVMPAFLRVTNPMYVKATEFSRADTAKAKQQGHDGLITLDDDGRPSQIAVFDGRQIKSAIGNRGTFDDSDNILFQRRTVAQAQAEAARKRATADTALGNPMDGERIAAIPRGGTGINPQRRARRSSPRCRPSSPARGRYAPPCRRGR
jgi:hypothetical protein